MADELKKDEVIKNQETENTEATGDNKTTDTVPYKRFKEVNDDSAKYKALYEQLQTQITTLTETLKSTDPGKIKAEYETKLGVIKQENTEAMKELSVKTELENVVDKDAFVTLFSKEIKTLEMDDTGKVKKEGLDALIVKAQADRPFLFSTEPAVAPATTNVANQGVPGNATQNNTTSKDQIISDYQKALKAGDTDLCITLKSQIWGLNK